MFSKLIRLLYILSFLTLSYGCNKVVFYNEGLYNPLLTTYFNPAILINLDKQFIICEQIFASKIDANYEASVACSTVKKKASLIKREYFSTCYLSMPISNTYKCTT